MRYILLQLTTDAAGTVSADLLGRKGESTRELRVDILFIVHDAGESKMVQPVVDRFIKQHPSIKLAVLLREVVRRD